jgi:chloramphenicol O-acetyltransferase type B
MKRLIRFFSRTWQQLLGKPESPKPFRSQKKFKKLYPDHEIGIGTYGLPIIRNLDKNVRVSIGSYCSIAKNVYIFPSYGHHRTDWISTFPFTSHFPEVRHLHQESAVSHGDVVIGSDVWLCSNTIILSGVNIGHGAVVASGAVVTKNVEPYSVVAGNPAKHINWRFDESARKALLESEWWNWPEDEIRTIVTKLCSDNVDDFITYINCRKHKPDQ